MIRNSLIGSLWLLTIACQNSAEQVAFLGGWSGVLSEPSPFAFRIELQKDSLEGYQMIFWGKDDSLQLPLQETRAGLWQASYGDQLSVNVREGSESPMVFLQTGHHLSYLDFSPTESSTWEAHWDLLISEGSSEPRFYVSFEQLNDDTYEAATYFKAPSYHYMYGQDLQVKDQSFTFRDIRSGITFSGSIQEGEIPLQLSFLKEKAEILLLPADYEDWAVGESDLDKAPQRNSPRPDPRFQAMIDAIEQDTLERTHAVLLALGDSIILEEYFDGFSPDIPHDTRSLSKTFASAMLGIAIADDYFPDEQVKMKPYLEKEFPNVDWSQDKDQISLFHLLTMSSGLDADDSKQNSFANEGAYQSREDWTRHILSSAMISSPGEVSNYGSANPHLLAPILQGQIEERLGFYIHEKLFGPLGFQNYRIQANNKELPYFGGGWYLRPRDLLKFGRLYLQKGAWEGRQIIPQAWVERSMQKHDILENTRDKNPYGYLFWHWDYQVGDKKLASVECRGAGGQYIFIIPELQLTAVITSGNYRTGKTKQPERIMEEFILPILVK